MGGSCSNVALPSSSWACPEIVHNSAILPYLRPMRVYCSDGEIFTSPEGLQFDYSMIFALEIKMVPNCSAIPVQDS